MRAGYYGEETVIRISSQETSAKATSVYGDREAHSNEGGIAMKLGVIVKLLIGIAIGIIIGLVAPLWLIRIFSSIGFVIGQYIKFVIPLLVIAFLGKGVADFGQKAGPALLLSLTLAYTSTILAELLGFGVAFLALPGMHIVNANLVAVKKIVPFVQIEIPPVMSIMTALVFAIVLGLGITWIGKKSVSAVLDEFHDIVAILVRKAVIPLFPYWVATVFIDLTAKGQLIPTINAFSKILLLVLPTQWAWLFILYLIAGTVSKQQPFRVMKAMLPAYFTAMGTMSSAATLPVALECAHKVPFLRKGIVDFCIPLFNIAHLPGAAIAITMSAMTVSLLTKGTLPSFGVMLPFIVLLGFIEVAAVGVPGGSVTAALGILGTVLLFGDTALGLMVALFMIQDSFGTAANVVGDGALTMMVNQVIQPSATENAASSLVPQESITNGI
jgi:Na+/H+-dicarboxylate symporter